MSRKLVREIPTTQVQLASVTFDNGKVKHDMLEPFIIYGRELSKEQATVAAMKYLKDNKIAVAGSPSVVDVSTTWERYEMSVEDFLKHATKIDELKKDATENNTTKEEG